MLEPDGVEIMESAVQKVLKSLLYRGICSSHQYVTVPQFVCRHQLAAGQNTSFTSSFRALTEAEFNWASGLDMEPEAHQLS